MEWTEEAIAIGTRRHGENGVILEVMTRGRGRCLGLVRGGRSRAMRPVLQPGNSLSVTWRARLEGHLGQFRAEPLVERAGTLMLSRSASYGLQLLAAHLRLLPERDPHPRLYDPLTVIINNLDDHRIAAEMIVRFEMLLLDELGFGMDLTQCAATGNTEDLAYVSPKSGRAVSREAGLPYDNRMLRLPRFLNNRVEGEPPVIADIEQGFALTGYFLDRHVLAPRGLSITEARDGFIRRVTER
ncbi:MAG TPA: DNA repair protein RecO [Afifellaceae bacterium]|nr:DNA repair protein RecO [Afifellaceae bacterium]